MISVSLHYKQFFCFCFDFLLFFVLGFCVFCFVLCVCLCCFVLSYVLFLLFCFILSCVLILFCCFVLFCLVFCFLFFCFDSTMSLGKDYSIVWTLKDRRSQTCSKTLFSHAVLFGGTEITHLRIHLIIKWVMNKKQVAETQASSIQVICRYLITCRLIKMKPMLGLIFCNCHFIWLQSDSEMLCMEKKPHCNSILSDKYNRWDALLLK